MGARQEFDPDLIIPDAQLSFDEGGIVPYNPDAAWNRSRFEALAKKYKFALSTPLNELPEKTLSIIFERLRGTMRLILCIKTAKARGISSTIRAGREFFPT